MTSTPACNGGHRKTGTSTSTAGTLDDTTQRPAQRRWNLLRTHVRVTRRLSQELAHKHARRFSSAQQSLVDACVGCSSAPASKDCPLDTLLAVRNHFLSLLDAEHCVLSFELLPSGSVIEFDGRGIRQVVERSSGTTARRQARGTTHQPSFFSTAKACARVERPEDCKQLQSYLCMPLVDCSDQVRAVVEVFNTRHAAQDITAWLGDCDSDCSLAFRSFKSTSEPLRVFCGFVGGLLRAAAPIEAFVDYVRNGDTVDPMPTIYRHTGQATSDSEEAPVQLLDFLQRALGVDGWIVYALDRDVKTLWARLASAGFRTKVSTVRVGQGVIGRAASTAEPLFDRDVLCVPMFDHSREHTVNSVAVFYGTTTGAFRQCDVELCNVICRHVGSSLQRLALEDAANKAQEKAQALLELSDLLFRELERSPKPTTMLLTAARVLVQKSWLRIAECNVYLRDPLTHELYSPGNATQGEYRVPLSSGSARAMVAVRTGNVVNIRDNEAGSLSHEKYAKPVLAVPVKDPMSGAVLAVLELLDKRSSTEGDLEQVVCLEKLYFDEHDEDVARGIARQVASALRNTQRLDAARTAQRKSAALLSLRLPAATGTMPGEQVGAVFSFVETAARRALRASHGALFLVDAPSRSLFARVGADWRGYALPIGQKLQGRVAATGAAVRLVREARIHPEFDGDYDRLMGMQTSSLLCVPIKAQPSMSASSTFASSGASTRSGRRCSSSFSTSSSTDDDGDDRPVIGVFYAVNKMNSNGETEGFDAEDEQVLRAICVELSALVERRAWELVFESPSYDDSDSSDSEGESHVTRTFLSQYTTASPMRRRRRPRSRLPSVVSDHDHAAAIVAATSYHEGCFLSSSGLSSLSGSIGLVPGQEAQIPVLQWNLDPWQFSPAQLIDLAVEMFAFHELMDGFALPEATLRRFLHSVQAQYLDVPYHNTYHAFATLHMTFLMLSAQSKKLAASLIPASTALGMGPTTKAQAIERTRQKRCGELILAPRERLAIFVAAFCHDMGHDARTNDFHVRCSSRLARRYNDHSVLENMHAAACFETMRRPGHDVLAGLEDGSSDTAGSRRAVRKRIIRAILATDMHRHASIVAKLHEAQARGSRNDDETLRELLVDAVVHSADISGPTQTEEQHFRWTTRLLEEFNEQHAEEVELGISATSFMDGRPESAEFARVNLAFVDSCAFPLWKALGEVLAGLEGCLANVETNRTMWATRLEEATKLEAENKVTQDTESPERLHITQKLVGEAGGQGEKFLTPTKVAKKATSSMRPPDLRRQRSEDKTGNKTYTVYATTKKPASHKKADTSLKKTETSTNIPQQKAKRKLELR
ncbi:3'5'-cyclic nucleotide phosphodiesterase, putative [Phytophthora infestans T30-4]|uniref:Phosphodiesterase n=2 Tax=Phytophthora infestans TaxID=4787 RepID=D0MRT8_PHYIT|nr:3'5'-cyclic nucleotide phosphodiesterase, putative [Phytophthora infestans T30-4]EEY58207.1 3'5'-cyclic nucleotide phosphodiesterase, putative [Phytophthora infestans T30-4]KAF4149971.1 3'5'-cyclic nucleotide phosphodiesterase [Phytophthora infestans]|eukprot:XP_002909393.1 3'5'-cyclic nucleotide phosphodiesterase, putative [Phytophthora infestans T30-4]